MTAATFDLDLFAQYRAAPDGPRKTMLANRLYKENKGLVVQLTAQLLGQGKPKPGAFVPAKLRRENRAENVESWDDALGAAGVAFGKALRDYDPRKGKISFHLGMKIKYELQCLIEHSQNIRVKRAVMNDEAPKAWVRDDGLDDGPGFEGIVHRWRLEDEKADEKEDQRAPAWPTPLLPRGAVEDFLARGCVFHARVRIPRAVLFAAYRRHALDMGFPVVTDRLRAALRARRVAPVAVRPAPGAAPEWGFRGVSLRGGPVKVAT